MVTNFLKTKRTFLVCTFVLILVYALSGFLLAPWLLQKQLQQVLAESYNSELSIEKTRINPFSFTLTLDNVELADPAGSRLLRTDNFTINFQLSSIFHRAWTFEEVSVSALELFVARDQDNSLNFAYFAAATDSELELELEVEVSKDESAQSGALPPLLVRNFVIRDSLIHFSDEMPENRIESRLGPINIELSDLSTLTNRVTQQEIIIAYENTGLISLVGDLQLDPLALSGSINIKGDYFPLLSQYMRDDIGVEITRGDIDIGLEYSVSTDVNEELKLLVSNLNFSLEELGVRTYAQVTDDPDDIDQEFFSLQALTISNVSLRWPEQVVSVDAIAVDGPAVHLFRDESGLFELSKLPMLRNAELRDAEDSQVENGGAQGAESEAQPWAFTLGELAMNHLVADLSDQSMGSEGEIGLSDFNFVMNDISVVPGQQFPMQLSAELLSGGGIELQGQVEVLPEPAFELAVTVDALALGVLQPYVRESLDIDFRSGELNLDANIIRSTEETLGFNGGAEIVDLAVYETEEGALIGSWETLRAEAIALSLTNATLAVSELELTRPYADIEIARNGSLNLGRMSAESDTERGSAQVETPAIPESEAVVLEMASETEVAALPMEFIIGRINIIEGAADFADYSLPLPFSAAIEQLNGSMTTIATNSSEPSQVSFEGQVDEFGLLRISGHISPLDPKQNTDISLNFQNVNIPKFSAYTIPFAGREISNGLLDLELGYKINDSQLEGNNLVVLRDIKLGERVEHPDAVSLPLDLAVALLKGPDGNIDLDLPVSGNVDDPEFNFGNVIAETFSNIIVNIVASPFKLLASLVGFEENELEYIEFVAGRAELAPPQQEKAAKLAEALMLRPELILELSGAVDPENDAQALRAESFEALLEERILALESDNGEGDMYVQQRRVVVETLYREYLIQNPDALTLPQLQQGYMQPVGGESGQAAEDADEENKEQRVVEAAELDLQLDELAYMNALATVLTLEQSVSPEDFEQLANTRANNIRMAVLENAANLQSRVSLMEMTEVSADAEEGIRMKINISVGSR